MDGGEGTSHGLLKFENGAVAHMAASWGIKYKETPALLHIHTTEATFVLDRGMQSIDVIDANGKRTVFGPIPHRKQEEGTNALYECEHFLNCIVNGTKPDTDGNETMKSLRAIWDMYESASRKEGTA
ncbi:hypothetical protein N6H14_26065 [Paenibacillus sp. CC-CFT747]|nr:hypothetical protein N6H14_26065 [Paenibacillus sp. CC-CFT747]